MRCAFAILLLCAAAPAGGREVAAVRLREALTADVRPRVLFPQARFSLLVRRPDGLRGVPALSPKARYAVLKLGKRTITLAFDAPEGAAALGLLYGGGKDSVLGRARAAGKEAFAVDFESATCGGLVCNVRLLYRRYTLFGGVLESAQHMRGKTVLGGVVREVVLVDGDADGNFSGPKDRWVALRADKARHIKTLSKAAALLLKEPQIPFDDDGRALMVENVAADGTTLALVLDKPRVAMRAVLDRRYAEVRQTHFGDFERELVGFVRLQGLDTRRERVARIAPWKAEPLSEAKKRARREGKPLLAFFFTESNPWCYRYEYYTFTDAEVDTLLRRFTRVRIDAEKDAEKSYQSLGPRGLPALVPLTADGKPVSFRLRSGTKDLPRPESAVTGWQRPKELALNLKRILKACSER